MVDLSNIGHYLVVASISYLVGSVPFAFIWTLVITRKDLRKLGSGNITVYNSYHNAGLLPAALTFVGNAALGLGVVFFTRWYFPGNELALLTALVFVTAGAMWPVWMAFSGGKGTTTWGWATVAISTWIPLALLGLWFAGLLITRRTFPSSTLVYRALPIVFGLIGGSWEYGLAGLVLTIMFHLKHRVDNDDSIRYGIGRQLGVNKS
jgi:glycerol-3-phosphate acyltransferase PlsY